MTRGRKPNPVPLLKLRGSRSYTLNRVDSEPPQMEDVKTLTPNTTLNAEAAAIWKNVTAYLAKMLILGQVDPDVLARYCEMRADWNRLSSDTSLNGAMYRAKISPVLSRLEASLGLTPTDRRNVAIPKAPEKKDDPLSRLMRARSS